MTRRRPGRWDVARGAVIGLVLGVSVVASWSALYWLVPLAPFAAVGAVLVLRRSENPIGWLLLGLICAASFAFTPVAATPAEFVAGTASRLAMAQAVIAASVAGPGILVVLLALTLVLPSGSLPEGAWGVRARWALVATVAAMAVSAFGPMLSGLYFVGSAAKASVPNPLALAPEAAIWAPLQVVSLATILGALAAGAISTVVRARHASGIERLQFRWIVSALAAVTASVVFGTVTGLFIFAGVSLPLIPISIGIAVLRYRLYEIDRIISRTIGWATVSGVLIVVFAGAILLLQAALTPLTGGNTIAVAASTLLVAALFQPLRRRVQARVDRRFSRARYDAVRIVTAFTERLRDEVNLDQLGTEVRATVIHAVAPTSVTLWLRE